jgi:hypothetical protein
LQGQYPVDRLLEIKQGGYSGLTNIQVDPPKAKPSLVVLDMVKDQLRALDKSIPEIVDVMTRKANEYVNKVQPGLIESQKGITQHGQQFRESTKNIGPTFNRDYLQRMLDSLPGANPDERVAVLNGITVTNNDLASLRPLRALSDNVLRYLIEKFRSQAEGLPLSLNSKRDLIILSLADLHDLMRGNSASGSDINTRMWKDQTASCRGQGQTIFNVFSHIIVPIRLSPSHVVLADIHTPSSRQSTATYRPAQLGYEIVLFDTNQKEFRHLHNSIYLILKRFTYEELLDKSGLTQAECYQESLSYSFRRGTCPQSGAHSFGPSREVDPDAAVLTLGLLKRIVEGGDPENVNFGARDIDSLRLELLGLTVENTIKG